MVLCIDMQEKGIFFKNIRRGNWQMQGLNCHDPAYRAGRLQVVIYEKFE